MSFMLALLLLASSPEYCAGYYKGYRDGFCSDLSSCNGPKTYPECPSSEGGYSVGYSRGLEDSKKRDRSKDGFRQVGD